MTFEHAFDVLAPYVVPPIILAAATWAAAVLSGLTKRLQQWLDAHQQTMASAVLADASQRVQAAMQNAAGQIALEVQQGKLNLDDIQAVTLRLAQLADGVMTKLPEAIQQLKPAPGAVMEGIRGKITTALPTPAPEAPSNTVWLHPSPAPAAAPTEDLATGTFQARAAIVVGRLMRDLQLQRFQAAGIVGNLGQESGLKAINEVRPIAGRGGWGWAQWTGPRRTAMEEWCKAQGLQVTDEEANYGFLVHELQTTERAALDALRLTTTLEEATRVFEEKYERAGVVAMTRRQTLAEQAMAA